MGKVQAGDITCVKQGIIIHGCNARGKMASGVAMALRQTFPVIFDDYRKAHQKPGGLRLGQVVWSKISQEPKLAIANAITQQNYGRDPGVRYVDYDAIAIVFRKVADVARRNQLTVHYPMIGAGLANGDWGVIRNIIKEELEGVERKLWILPAQLKQYQKRWGRVDGEDSEQGVKTEDGPRPSPLDGRAPT